MEALRSKSRSETYMQLHEEGMKEGPEPGEGPERAVLWTDDGPPSPSNEEAGAMPLEGHKLDYVSTVMLCVATFCLFADQNLMAPNLQAIADDFGLKGKQKDQFLGGIMSIAFFFVGAPSSVLVGSLADSPKVNRVILFTAVLLVGEIPAALTIFVGTGWIGYWQLFVLRSITGVAIGGALPVVLSILADIYSSSQRNVASAVYSTAMGAGLVFGQTFAALVGSSNWRIPFVLVAVPSIGIALGCLIVIKEPKRGAAEEALAERFKSNPNYEYREDVGWRRKFVQAFTIPSNILIIIQGVPGSIPWGVLNVYLNDYLNTDAGLSLADSTSVVVTFAVGCGLIGNAVGGVLGQFMWNKSPRLVPLAMGITTIAATFPVEVLINFASRMSQVFRLGIAFLAGSVACFTAANIRAVLMNVNTPNTRGTVFACFNLMNDIGAGLGPGLVSVFVTLFESRRTAFSVAVTMWFLCGALQGSLFWTVPQDVVRVRNKLAEQAELLEDEDLDVLLPASDARQFPPSASLELTSHE